MIAICIEASHSRGLGHLFRAIHLCRVLKEHNEPHLVLVNSDATAASILDQCGIPWLEVPLHILDDDWETALIRKYGIKIWLNDRMATDQKHALRIVNSKIPLATVDDHGSGAAYAELHFAPLLATQGIPVDGKKVFSGPDYLALNPDIERYRYQRGNLSSLVISMGGSDTHGSTIKVLKLLQQRRYSCAITVITGPAFAHKAELQDFLCGNMKHLDNVASLPREFARHDLAITGGGVTPFEACAAGLPCIVVANEDHEIPVGRFLAKTGAALFAGHHEAIDQTIFDHRFNLKHMSEQGMRHISCKGAENLFQILIKRR